MQVARIQIVLLRLGEIVATVEIIVEQAKYEWMMYQH
jgi:hypothetical protein